MGTSSAMNTDNQYIKYKITVKQNSQNIANNYSNVTVTVNFYRTNTGYTSYGTGTLYCKINGTTYTASVSPSQKITNSGINLFSKTLNIYHNSNGTKTLTTSAWIKHNVVTSSEQSYNQTLTTIPRTSNMTLSASSVDMGKSITIYTNRASSSFTHSLYYQINSTGSWYTIGSGITTSKAWTVPLSLSNNIPNGTKLTLKLSLDTYSGSTLIGNSQKTITANVPTSVVPTISSVAFTEAVSGIATKFGGFVKSKSKLKGTVTASGAYSSTIKSYSSKINNATYTTKTFTTDYILGNGSCVTTVYDSRGRKASKTTSYTVLDYSDPIINTFTVSRCNLDGTLNDNGTYAKCTIKATISPVGNKNDKTFKLLYKKTADKEYTTVELPNDNYTLEANIIIDNFETDSSYDFTLQAKDYFLTKSYNRTLPTVYALLDFNESGKGIAIGKVSTENALEIDMEMHTADLIRVGNRTDYEKNIRFQNLAESQGKTYANDGVYPHSCKMYGGDQTSPIGIGWFDSANNYRILAYNDYEQKLRYGAKGLYSTEENGTWLNQYGNIFTQTPMSTGSWGIYNGDTTCFKVNWADGILTGSTGNVLQAKKLYTNSSGTTGTITLPEAITNFSYIEIVYKSNSNYRGSTRVIPYNGIIVNLHNSLTNTSTSTLYYKGAAVTISGTSLTWNYNSEASIKTGATTLTTSGNFIYILNVIGYR